MPGYSAISRFPLFNSWGELNKTAYAGSCSFKACPDVFRSRPVFNAFQKFTNKNHYWLPNHHKLSTLAKSKKASGAPLQSTTVPLQSRGNNQENSFLLIVKTEDFGLLKYRMGEKSFSKYRDSYQCKITEALSFYYPIGIEGENELVLVSFVSASQAINFAETLFNSLKEIKAVFNLRMVLKVSNSNKLNIDESNTNCFFFYKLKGNKLLVDREVLPMDGEDHLDLLLSPINAILIAQKEQNQIMKIFQIVKKHWQNPSFNAGDLCRKVSFSSSRLYRSCKTLTGISPIRLIREYRLLRSLRFLRTKRSITQILYDSGFNSPSYFSRCFKKRFGISPIYYIKHLI